MHHRESAVKGCLLGMAVGDAMGYPIDKKSWAEISEAYGDNGLLGYDLMDATADVTSYTQLAAYACNGMLLGACRAHFDRYGRYVVLSLREWAKSQQFRGTTEKTYCWLPQVPELRRRLCMDTRLQDALRKETLGTPEAPTYRFDTPSSLTLAFAVGILFDPGRQTPEAMRRLAIESVALTHGDQETFLSAAVAATAIALILQDRKTSLETHFLNACQAADAQFEDTFPAITKVTDLVRQAVALSKDPELSSLAAMTILGCRTGAGCLAGSMYAALCHQDSFDDGMIASVNHSGFSGATGAMTGAFLGARLGAEALPEFYLESLEAAPWLEELAIDIVRCRQSMLIFDDSWDHKYVQGLPPEL
ncbi:MAG: ADP-ribosylglycohydrolase family protein [Oscillospiraceae bacterium]|nr:ADP-ribosylglycohydrolase family protein [Oscillospiraceae bacterium]